MGLGHGACIRRCGRARGLGSILSPAFLDVRSRNAHAIHSPALDTLGQRQGPHPPARICGDLSGNLRQQIRSLPRPAIRNRPNSFSVSGAPSVLETPTGRLTTQPCYRRSYGYPKYYSSRVRRARRRPSASFRRLSSRADQLSRGAAASRWRWDHRDPQVREERVSALPLDAELRWQFRRDASADGGLGNVARERNSRWRTRSK